MSPHGSMFINCKTMNSAPGGITLNVCMELTGLSTNLFLYFAMKSFEIIQLTKAHLTI